MSAVPPKAAECERLAAELRALRDRTGLSLAELGKRTPYSKSSWQRYLGGTKPAPRQAVEALCALADEPAGRLLVLWELADAAWSGRAGTTTAPTAVPAPVPGSVPSEAATAGGTGEAATETSPGASSALSPAVSSASGQERWPSAVPVPVSGGGKGRFGGPGRSRLLVLAAVAVTGGSLLAVALANGDGAAGTRGGAEPSAAAGEGWVTATPAMPGCAGPSCEGKHPEVMGCGGTGMVDTLRTFSAEDGQRLELRYGKACHAVWVRATGLRLGDEVTLRVGDRPVQKITALARRDTVNYVPTPMAAADDPSDARVCLRPGADGADAGQECFGR
ncbi:helix-turn-helix domain-containing protein [Streptomyces sp. NPDC004749]